MIDIEPLNSLFKGSVNHDPVEEFRIEMNNHDDGPVIDYDLSSDDKDLQPHIALVDYSMSESKNSSMVGKAEMSSSEMLDTIIDHRLSNLQFHSPSKDWESFKRSPLYSSSLVQTHFVDDILIPHNRSPLYSLIQAIHNKKSESSLIRFISDWGIDINVCDERGRFPLDEAIKSNHKIVNTMIRSLGAKLRRSLEYNESPLIAALVVRHSDVLQHITVSGIDYDDFIRLCRFGLYNRCPILISDFIRKEVSGVYSSGPVMRMFGYIVAYDSYSLLSTVASSYGGVQYDGRLVPIAIMNDFESTVNFFLSATSYIDEYNYTPICHILAYVLFKNDLTNVVRLKDRIKTLLFPPIDVLVKHDFYKLDIDNISVRNFIRDLEASLIR